MESPSPSQASAYKALDILLQDFGIPCSDGDSTVKFTGDIPSASETHSQDLNLSLVGSVPSAANAYAATKIYEERGGKAQDVEVDLRRGHNYIDPDIGMTPSINGQEITVDLLAGNPFIRGIYETKDGRHIILSAVYVDLVYQWTAFLGCSVLDADVRAAVKQWNADDIEAACEKAGLPMAVIRSQDEWLQTPQGKHMSTKPIVEVQHIPTGAPPRVLSPNPRRPLEGIKVLCMTHAIAGPSTGRTLAEHGASVVQVMFTHGFEHSFVYTYANLGTASTRLNLHKEEDRQRMWKLVGDADVWVDSYREGSLGKFGFSDDGMHKVNPALIIAHVRCYGISGPWRNRPGFDMQGSASSGIMAHCGDGVEKPSWPPGMVINDYTTGYYSALAIQSCLLKQIKSGGGYILGPSLTQTASSILRYFKSTAESTSNSNEVKAVGPRTLEAMTGMGYLKTLKPLPELSRTPIKYDFLLVPIGSSPPAFPGKEDEVDVRKVQPREKETALADFVKPFLGRLERLSKFRKGGSPNL